MFDQLVRLRQLIYGFLEGKVNAEQIFDLEKYATLFVVSDLMNEKHALFLANTRLYFNPISSLIEPIGREWGYMNEVTHADKKVSLSIEEPVDNYHKAIHADVVLGKIVDSHTFKEAYLKKANMISSRSYLEQLLKEKAMEIKALMGKINTEYPFKIIISIIKNCK